MYYPKYVDPSRPTAEALPFQSSSHCSSSNVSFQPTKLIAILHSQQQQQFFSQGLPYGTQPKPSTNSYSGTISRSPVPYPQPLRYNPWSSMPAIQYQPTNGPYPSPCPTPGSYGQSYGTTTLKPGPGYNSQAYTNVPEGYVASPAYQSPPVATSTQAFTSWLQTVPSCPNQQSVVPPSFNTPTTSYRGSGQPPLNGSTRGYPGISPTLQTTSDVSYMGGILTPQNNFPGPGMAPNPPSQASNI
jgi:hypothetical protein